MRLPHQQVETPKAPETPQCHSRGQQNKGHLVLGLAVLWDLRHLPALGFTVGLAAQPCPSHHRDTAPTQHGGRSSPVTSEPQGCSPTSSLPSRPGPRPFYSTAPEPPAWEWGPGAGQGLGLGA